MPVMMWKPPNKKILIRHLTGPGKIAMDPACCCGVECELCDGGVAPLSVTITMVGNQNIASPVCERCGDLNYNPYTLVFDEALSEVDTCIYDLRAEHPVCDDEPNPAGYIDIQALLWVPSTTIVWRVVVNSYKGISPSITTLPVGRYEWDSGIEPPGTIDCFATRELSSYHVASPACGGADAVGSCTLVPG